MISIVDLDDSNNDPGDSNNRKIVEIAIIVAYCKSLIRKTQIFLTLKVLVSGKEMKKDNLKHRFF